MENLLNKCVFLREEQSEAHSSAIDLKSLDELYVSKNKAKFIPAGNYVSVSVKEGFQEDVKTLPCGARSLLVHPETGNIQARGVNKFFSLSELSIKSHLPVDWTRDAALWRGDKQRFEVYVQRKMAGFSVSFFSGNGKDLSIMSKHSVEGHHVEIAKKVLSSCTSNLQRQTMAHHLHVLNATASCECISLSEDFFHPVLEDERYDNQLVLFSIQLNMVAERSIDPQDLNTYAFLWGLKCVPQLRVCSQEELERIIFAVAAHWNPAIDFENTEKQCTADFSKIKDLQELETTKEKLAEGVVLVFAESASLPPFGTCPGISKEAVIHTPIANENVCESSATPFSRRNSPFSPSSEILTVSMSPRWMRLTRLKVKTPRYICMRNFRSLLLQESKCRSFLMHYVLLEWSNTKNSTEFSFRNGEEEMQVTVERCGVHALCTAFFSYFSHYSRTFYRDAVWSIGCAVDHLLKVTEKEVIQESYAPISFIILCGLPGSGKSTFAKKFLGELGICGFPRHSVAVTISRDRVYQQVKEEACRVCENESSLSKHQLRRLEQKVHTELVRALQGVIQLSAYTDGRVIVVLDACNSTPAARKFWRDVLPRSIDYCAIVHICCSDRSELQNRLCQRLSHERLSNPETAQRAFYAVEKKFVVPPFSLLSSQSAAKESNVPVYHVETASTPSTTTFGKSFSSSVLNTSEGMKQLVASVFGGAPLESSYFQKESAREWKEAEGQQTSMKEIDEKGIQSEVDAHISVYCSSLLNIDCFSSNTLKRLHSRSLLGRSKGNSASFYLIQLKLSVSLSELQEMGVRMLLEHLQDKILPKVTDISDIERTAAAINSVRWTSNLGICLLARRVKEKVVGAWHKKEANTVPSIIPTGIRTGHPYWLGGWLGFEAERNRRGCSTCSSTSSLQERDSVVGHQNHREEKQMTQQKLLQCISHLGSVLSSRFSKTPSLPHVTLCHSGGDAASSKAIHYTTTHSDECSSSQEETLVKFLNNHNLHIGKVLRGEITDLLIDRYAWVFKVRLFCDKMENEPNTEVPSTTEWVNQVSTATEEVSNMEKKTRGVEYEKPTSIPLHITLGTVPEVPSSYAGEMFSKFEEWDKENSELAYAQKSLSAKRSRQKYHNFLQLHLFSPLPFSGTINSDVR